MILRVRLVRRGNCEFGWMDWAGWCSEDGVEESSVICEGYVGGSLR